MADSTARALQLLELLQQHRHWSGPRLAEELGVTTRTLRRDIEQLREFGYRIESLTGPAGGYRLEAGAALPPLVLTDDEAVTMAIGLRLAATAALDGDGGATTLTALAKLEQVMPAGIRRRVNALAAAVQPVRLDRPPLDPELLGALALACRDTERIRFHYTAGTGAESERNVEPYVLVPAERNWFLLAFDLHRADWRTFRVDRISRLYPTRVRFAPRRLPAEDAAEYVRVAVTAVPMALRADVVMDLPFPQMRDYFGPWSRGATPEGEDRTRWPIGGHTVSDLVGALAWIPPGVRYVLEASAELRAEVAREAERMREAATMSA